MGPPLYVHRKSTGFLFGCRRYTLTNILRLYLFFGKSLASYYVNELTKELTMNQRIKIFIVEYDCVNLITLMLWLDQFPEFEVLGTTVDDGALREQIDDLKPDVVLLDIETPG